MADGNKRDAGPANAPKGAPRGHGKRQRSLEYLLLLRFSLLIIFVEENVGCTAVCNVLRSMLCRATTELCLLTLYELLFLVGTSVDLVAAE